MGRLSCPLVGQRLVRYCDRAILGVILTTSALASAGVDERSLVVPETLYRKARDAGSVRVIVRLRVVAIPEGQPGGGNAVASQRRAIAAAQSALLAELAGRSYRVIRIYETIPFLALEVSEDSLRALEGSALVVGVEEDRVDSATPGADGVEGGNEIPGGAQAQ